MNTRNLFPYILANALQWWVVLLGLVLLFSCTPTKQAKGERYADPRPQTAKFKSQ